VPWYGWLAVDLALVVAALIVAGLIALRLWRQVRATVRAVREAADQVESQLSALNHRASSGSLRSYAGPAGRD
jgi:HAMP domain-containing protein